MAGMEIRDTRYSQKPFDNPIKPFQKRIPGRILFHFPLRTYSFSLILPFHFPPHTFHFYSCVLFFFPPLPRITFPRSTLLSFAQYHSTIPLSPSRLLSPFLSIDRVHRVSSSLFPASCFPRPFPTQPETRCVPTNSRQRGETWGV